MSWAIANHIDRGLASARPAAGAVPGKHYGWFATDTGVLSISDGSTWVEIGSSALAAHLADTSDAHDASAISVLDAGNNFTATDVEAALAELFAAIATGGIPVATIDAKGDLLVGSANDAVDNLTVGSDGKVLTADAASTLGVKWDTPAAGVSYATPAIVLGSSAAAGAASTVIRSDGTIAAFDATSPTAQAFGDSAVVGTAAFAARRDHKHAMPAVDNSTVEINAATLRVKADGITANEIAAGAVGASELASTAVAAGTYGDSSHVAQVTFDADGRATSASSVAIPGVGSGGSVKLYDYEVTGSDKASIDTAVDGTTVADFAGYSILEVWFLARTDQAATVFSSALMRVNNDSSSIYDLARLQGINTTVGAATVRATAQWTFDCPGAGASANYYTAIAITFPFHTGTVAYKIGTMNQAEPDSTAANNASELIGLAFRSTAALTRIALLNSSTFKFKVGTRLIVFGR